MEKEPILVELMEEMRFATKDKFKSKHDDVADTMSMLLDMDPYPPGEEDNSDTDYTENEEGTFAYNLDREDDFDDARKSTIF